MTTNGFKTLDKSTGEFMKKVLCSLILISSLAQAGVIENRKTGEKIHLSIGENKPSLLIEFEDGASCETSLDEASVTSYRELSYDDEFAPYEFTNTLIERKEWELLFFPVTGALVVGFDTLMTPYTIPKVLIHKIKVKEDMKSIMKAIKGKEVKVSNMRFEYISKGLKWSCL